MVWTALVVGGLALYYFGVRAAAWAAGAAVVLSLLAMLLPRWAMPINVVIAAGAFALWAIGRRRPRPPDAVLVVRAVRGAAARAYKTLRGGK